jgi:hypothetical protein
MKNRAERVLLSFKAAVNDVTDLRPADGQGALILAWPRALGSFKTALNDRPHRRELPTAQYVWRDN